MPSSCGPRLSWRPRIPPASAAERGRRRASSISVASRTSQATGWSRRRASRSRHAASATSAPSWPARSLPRPCTRRHASSGSCTSAASGPNRRTISSSAQVDRPCPSSRARARPRAASRWRTSSAAYSSCVSLSGRFDQSLKPSAWCSLTPTDCVEHPLQRERPAQPGEPAGQLDVEHAGRPGAEVQREPGQVGRRRVHHLVHVGIGQQLRQRLQRRALDRVDHRQPVGWSPPAPGTAAARRSAPTRTRCRARSGPRPGRRPTSAARRGRRRDALDLHRAGGSGWHRGAAPATGRVIYANTMPDWGIWIVIAVVGPRRRRRRPPRSSRSTSASPPAICAVLAGSAPPPVQILAFAGLSVAGVVPDAAMAGAAWPGRTRPRCRWAPRRCAAGSASSPGRSASSSPGQVRVDGEIWIGAQLLRP